MKRLIIGLGLPALALAMLLAALGGVSTSSPAHAAPPGYVANSALILGSSTTPGTATAGTALGGADPRSLEEEQANLAGFTATVVSDVTWAAMTAADFDNYQVIILGDPTCSHTSYVTALANAAVWQPVVMSSGGNKYLTGSDDTFHHRFGTGGAQSTFLGGPGGAAKAVGHGIGFAGAVSGATGAYISLSCDGEFSPAGTPLLLMDGLSIFGTAQFTYGGAPCSGAISLVANFPGEPVPLLTGADLSAWGCSVHAFIDTWPGDWVPLALATDPVVPATYTATDIDTGLTVTGSPYRLISGVGITVTSDLTLSPETATNPVGTSHTVTATVVQTSDGVTTPVVGVKVTFAISAGPNAGLTGSCITNAVGQCTFTYTDTGGAGTDSIIASTTVGGLVQTATAAKTWAGGPVIGKNPQFQNLWLCTDESVFSDNCNSADIDYIIDPTITTADPKCVGFPNFRPDAECDRQDVGAWEFEVRFDAKYIDVQLEAGYPLIPGTDVCQTYKGQGVVQIVCNTKRKDLPLTGISRLAVAHITPTSDTYSLLMANQDNGIVTQLINQDCNLSDTQGHPIPDHDWCANDGAVTIRYLEGDVHADCVIDIHDQQQIAFRWGSHLGQLLYNSRFDLEPSSPKLGDGDIDGKDIQTVFGRHDSDCKAPHPEQPPIDPKSKEGEPPLPTPTPLG